MFLPLDLALLAATLVLAADDVPALNVESFCRRVAAMTQAPGELDLCLRKELEARDQLARQWTQFPVADRAYCRQLSTLGGDPVYTELLTCLELQRDARNLRERNLRDKDEETSGASPRPRRRTAPLHLR